MIFVLVGVGGITSRCNQTGKSCRRKDCPASCRNRAAQSSGSVLSLKLSPICALIESLVVACTLRSEASRCSLLILRLFYGTQMCQYKLERECNAVLQQSREEKIARMECLMDGLLPSEAFKKEEWAVLKLEHKVHENTL